MAVSKTKLDKQIKEVLAMAENRGVQSNLFFATTLERYKMQMEILDQLEKAIRNEETLITKEYVKGRKNLVINPAITEYNRTTTAANNTVITLLNIVKKLPKEEGGEKSKLEEMLSGLNE